LSNEVETTTMNKKVLIAASFLLMSSLYYGQDTKEEKSTESKEKKIEEVALVKGRKAVEQKADRTIFDFSDMDSR